MNIAKHAITKEYISKSLKILIYTILAVVLFITPLLRAGMFFERENLYITFMIYIALLLWGVYKFINNERINIKSITPIMVLILPIAYILPLLFGYAADRSMSMNYIMRYLSYASIFFIVSDMASKDKKIIIMGLYIMTLSAVISGILGIDAVAGEQLSKILNLQSIGINMGRLNGMIQYPNISGLYFSAGFLMLIAVSILSTNRYLKSILSGLMYIMLTTLLLTVSRGAILILPVAYILIIVMLPDKHTKIEIFLITIIPAIVSLLLYSKLQTASPILTEGTGSTFNTWILVLLGIIISSVITYIMLIFIKSLENVSDKVYSITIISIIAIVLLGVLIIWATGIYTKIIPPFLLERLTQTGEQATSGRITFYKDGLKVLKEHWLLGAGGGAWEALYRKYQSYNYASSELHSMVLQVWLETGIIGILAYAGIVLSIIKQYISNKKNQYPKITAILLGIITLLITHSVIDFSFSTSLIPTMLFVLLGAVESQKTKNIEINTKAILYIPITVGLISSILGAMFITARFYAVQATNIMNNRSFDIEIEFEELNKAISVLEKAIKLNPFNSDYYIADEFPDPDISVDLNTIYYTMFDKMAYKVDNYIAEDYIEMTERVLKLNPKSPILNRKIASTIIKAKITEDKASEYIEQAIYYNPMYPIVYEEASDIYIKIGEYYLSDNRKKRGNAALERVLQIPNDIEQVNKTAIIPSVLTQKTLDNIEMAKQLIMP